MDATAVKALHYETLVRACGGAESKAGEAFSLASSRIDVTDPLPLHIKEYASFMATEESKISEAYYHCRPFFEEMGDKVLVIDENSPFWPSQVNTFAYAPRFLYVQGNVSLLKAPSVSVIGTRSPSLEGKKLALQTSHALAKAEYVVASGLALGIDGVAHKGALTSGAPTMAVIGTPLCQCYPKEHTELQAEIAKSGVVVSRFAPSTTTQKWHFLLRNRLMSALSLASVVVEDRDGGGAVRQASFALEQKKYLFIYQSSIENRSILWPRKFAGQSRVFVIRKSEDLPRILKKAMETKRTVGRPKDPAIQLDLFALEE
ncbi:DNA-processing protein DprA [uncultured Sphaerochaeta sp.]|uniref:DNA-processing protein DprA n=1 Tax=uncultured Sphaerochaeta sp. TaxID=886478 RepID=UPI0029CA2DA2|nr:DNA-processing protein DprA [uncultured Sphaerochaeta sp.]